MKHLICRQAIETKYLGPTNFKGSRIKASCAADSILVHWQGDLSVDQNHYRAAWLLVQKLEWDKTSRVTGLSMGQLKNGNYCFVLKEKRGAK